MKFQNLFISKTVYPIDYRPTLVQGEKYVNRKTVPSVCKFPYIPYYCRRTHFHSSKRQTEFGDHQLSVQSRVTICKRKRSIGQSIKNRCYNAYKYSIQFTIFFNNSKYTVLRDIKNVFLVWKAEPDFLNMNKSKKDNISIN